MNFPLLTPELHNEFKHRIKKIRRAMEALKVDAVLATSSANLFYTTGGVCRGYFYIPLEGDEIFFTIPPSESDSPLNVSIRKPEQIVEKMKERSLKLPRRIGLEFDDLYYSEVERLKAVFDGCEYANGSTVFRTARMTKTDYEVKKMRIDGLKQSAVYSRIKRCYKEDMTDVEFQIEIEKILRQEGCLGFLRAAGSRMEINMGSVLAGPNADVPSPYDFSMGGEGTDPSLPVGASGVIMRHGMTVMVDMNGGFNGYQTDMTRCWSVGDPDQKTLRMHECSIMILRDLEQFVRPGVEISEIYRRAARMASDDGFAPYFMGHAHKVAFIGHGVGIELNEAPVIMERNKMLIEDGMTIALEPKFVIPEVGAVGVENTYVVRDTGLENLTDHPEALEPF